MNRIEDTFKRLRQEGRKAFIPYIMAGDPSLGETKKLVYLLERSGADIIELGVPFTDPLADGPTIQAAAERALKRGVTLRKVVGTVEEIRKKSRVPIILMTYYNPVFRYGISRFLKHSKAAGVDGLIIPDLPPDEAGELTGIAHEKDVATIFLLAPTSTEDRINLVSRASTGFIYYVSITGITGSKLTINGKMKSMVGKIRSISGKPVAIGFGVKKPEEAKAVAEIADGVIVGSSIVRMVNENIRGLPRYLKSLRRAI
ncbi:MAG TPA: tryptophan synthase subunit alpha [Nitrospirae bacterium]|nr:tryptophan synthase subunit alpha [Nitrospirota bacterium]HDY72117.1 tryptophan synthase subunit alpha [Nitrospirota bacterium]